MRDGIRYLMAFLGKHRKRRLSRVFTFPSGSTAAQALLDYPPCPNMSSLTLTANSTTEERFTFVAKLLSDSAEVLAKNPGNRCCKYLANYLKSEEVKELSNDGKRQYTLRKYV